MASVEQSALDASDAGGAPALAERHRGVSPEIPGLLVIWREPSRQGTRHVVGRLVRDSSHKYRFTYSDDLSEVEKQGFQGVPEFSTELREHISGHLFATFAMRIPHPRRPDRDRLLKEWGVENPDDALEILARSGGFKVTDRIELAELRPDDDDLRTPLEFRVAGQRHYDDPEASIAAAGDRIALIREPENTYDPHATMVVCGDSTIGYVPRQYSRLFARILDLGGKVEAFVARKILVPEEGYRWVIRACSRP